MSGRDQNNTYTTTVRDIDGESPTRRDKSNLTFFVRTRPVTVTLNDANDAQNRFEWTMHRNMRYQDISMKLVFTVLIGMND